MSLSILHYPSPILSATSKPVELVDFEFLKELEGKCTKDKVFGIAAPQVGVSQRIFVALIEGKYKTFVNPYVLKSSEILDVAEEACLSLPGISFLVERPLDILVSYAEPDFTSRELKNVNRKLFKMDARVFMHECDHLNGQTILDKLGPVKRDLYLRKYLKFKKHHKDFISRMR
jgi:peptide deformylase